MRYSLITGPTEEPITLQEVKDQLRIDINDDDALLRGKILSARQAAEEKYGVAFVTQTWDLYLDAFPGTELVISKWPLVSITSIKYYDEDNNESTYSSANYVVDAVSQPGRVLLKRTASWPGDQLRVANGVIVRFVAGYGGKEDVPQPIKQALLLLIGDMYENREDTIIAQGVTIQRQAQAAAVLMQNYRNF